MESVGARRVLRDDLMRWERCKMEREEKGRDDKEKAANRWK